MTRAVENAIRGCGPCSPEPEAAAGGMQDVVLIFSPFICCINLLHLYLLHLYLLPLYLLHLYLLYLYLPHIFATYICYTYLLHIFATFISYIVFATFICYIYLLHTGVEDVLMEVKDLSTGVFGEPYKVGYCKIQMLMTLVGYCKIQILITLVGYYKISNADII